MLKKLLYWVTLITLILISLVAWQLPAILQRVPSRYVARLPEPMQALGRVEVARIVPTAVAPAIDDATLLSQPPTPLPPTPTPPPTVVPVENAPPPTPTPLPTATTPPISLLTTLPASVRLEGVQHEFQGWNNCGPTTLAMSLSYFDLVVDQEETAAFLKPNPEDRNVGPDELADYVQEETALDALYRVNGSLETIKTFLANDIPVIVEIGIDPPGDYAWLEWYGHYLLVVAYDDINEQFFVYDSWLGTSEVPGDKTPGIGRRWGYAELDGYWQQFNRSYVALHTPEQADIVAAIVGDESDDTRMWQRSLEVAQSEAATAPDNPYAWFNVGTSYSALSDYASAAAAFDRAREIGLPRRMLWYQFGPYKAYYEQGRYDDVITLADVALDRPYIEEILYYRGLARAATGEIALAREDLAAAAAFNPRFADATLALQQLEDGG